MTRLFSSLLSLIFIFFITLMINSNLYAEEQIPDFPYDPEERATEIKRCASVCIRRQDICLQREDNSEESQQMCQSQFIICINLCK